MRTRRLACLALLAAGVAVPAADAPAAARKPTISAVRPARAVIGDRVSLTGREFLRGTGRNTVILSRPGASLVFVRAGRSSTTRLSFALPGKLLGTLPTRAGAPYAARYRIRVLARRLSDLTPVRRSLVVGPGRAAATPVPPPSPGSPGTPQAPAPAPVKPDCAHSAPPTDPATDSDGDTLPDVLERRVATDGCVRDTDLDGVEDGFEYRSALDLNSGNAAVSLPYPGKRPYPNPLDAGDAGIDYDGDVLSLAEEFAAWRDPRYGNHALPLNLSDGRQATRPQPVPDPAHMGDPRAVYAQDPSLRFLDADRNSAVSALELSRLDVDRDGTVQPEEYRYQDVDGSGRLEDDEQDVDGDGLNNADETHVRMQPAHWAAAYREETPYPIGFAPPDYLTPDSDGDGVLDGLDDQDFDGTDNLSELSRTAAQVLAPDGSLATPYQSALGQVNPFNPCLPLRSQPFVDLNTGVRTSTSPTCMRYPPVEGAPAPFDASPKYPNYVRRG